MNRFKIHSKVISNLKKHIKRPIPLDEVHLIWIGQAGFIIKFSDRTLLIDPYLSDFLAKKYENTIFPHVRLIDPPILPNRLNNINYVLSTHAHSDHMDPETLSIINERNPYCKFIVPLSEKKEAIRRGIQENSILPIDAGQKMLISEDICIKAIPSAHENLKIDKEGHHCYLGYILKFGKFTIYHSGDCTPYERLPEILIDNNIDLALLPINGRDEYRLKNNIAGNFYDLEAINLCKNAKIHHLIVHHFGMFAYNTVSEDRLEDLKELSSKSLEIIIPEINKIYIIK